MSKLKVVQMKERELSDKERYLGEFVKHAEALQSFLTSVNRKSDLWMIFNYLTLFIAYCDTESIEGKGYEQYYNKYDENGRIIREAEKR